MDFTSLYHQYQGALEDFWGRRDNRGTYATEFRLFGHLVRMSSNQEGVLAAGNISRQQYSIAQDTDDFPFTIRLIVRAAPASPGPVPENLDKFILYSADEDWLNLHAGGWANCFVELMQRRAVIVVTPQLAQRPDLVSRHLLNTVFNNLFTRNGYAMLHTTCLIRDDRVLLLIAPHGSGKSTTALHLSLAGYGLVSDSQVYVARRNGALQLTGFPVGRTRLRKDMLQGFPEFQPYLVPEPMRDEIKFLADLRQLAPRLVCEQAIYPERVELCLLTQSGNDETRLLPVDRSEIWQAIILNSLHFDTLAVWERNLALIELLVERARCHTLSVGSDVAGILSSVDSLWNEP